MHKVQRSGDSWWLNTLIKHFMLFFPSGRYILSIISQIMLSSHSQIETNIGRNCLFTDWSVVTYRRCWRLFKNYLITCLPHGTSSWHIGCALNYHALDESWPQLHIITLLSPYTPASFSKTEPVSPYSALSYHGVLLGQHEQQLRALSESHQALRNHVRFLTQQLNSILPKLIQTPPDPQPSQPASSPSSLLCDFRTLEGFQPRCPREGGCQAPAFPTPGALQCGRVFAGFPYPGRWVWVEWRGTPGSVPEWIQRAGEGQACCKRRVCLSRQADFPHHLAG